VNISFFDSVVFWAGIVIGTIIGTIPVAVLIVGLGFASDKERIRDALESMAKNVDIIVRRGK
jgi:predicted NBD/HSP70 family sugar kinase